METPASDVGSLDLPERSSALPPPPTRRLSASAVRLLERTVLPGLNRRGERRLARTVREALRRSETGRLAQLPERDRRTLLEVLEDRLRTAPPKEPPRSIVELTAFLGGIPEPEVRLSRWRTAPAR